MNDVLPLFWGEVVFSQLTCQNLRWNKCSSSAQNIKWILGTPSLKKHEIHKEASAHYHYYFIEWPQMSSGEKSVWSIHRSIILNHLSVKVWTSANQNSYTNLKICLKLAQAFPSMQINAHTTKVEENSRLLSRHHSPPSRQVFSTGRPNSLTHGLLAGLLHLCSFALGEWDDENDILIFIFLVMQLQN